ncbi:PEP-CTERM sorting domain-containing protein [Rugamonas sp. CCM 8940]|uniref:PEP-CTERM sorting domain-containing protein n=1 Tax=Rugamonas sp. CCM 8940 TaxID=2765359 RepID=UPI0018F738C0|nr:PEP-CTERM sorting domain-containing protein [Rugamonas sp. CCM 8940]MBJ7313741.1 PEP-CTERM sorting domain-containing protein [Rugamonas sp. CCM 8940]
MKTAIFAVALALSSIGAAQADSINGLVNTGAAAGLVDSNYTLSSNVSYVTANDGAFPFPYWSANTSTSRWIMPTALQGETFDPNSNGTYTWHLGFDLSGFDAASASFSGRFAADNAATAYLNGHALGTTYGFGESSWASLSASSYFVNGVNSLDFVVTNYAQNGGNPAGLRVEFNSSNITAVPEPETYAMLMAGLLLVGVVARRRKA